uniref:Uncharacterized protein n=1 Tax=Arundo donax TaxID=35708 RepID=A0A0A9AIA2_ARUDO
MRPKRDLWTTFWFLVSLGMDGLGCEELSS